MAINKKQIKSLLEAHEFGELFNQLGWDWPESDSPYPAQIGEEVFNLRTVAHKRGFVALHCASIPSSAVRAKIESRVSRDIREHLIIYTDAETKEQRWQWVRRVPGQPLSRKEHEYLPSQPMLLIEKIGYLEVGMDEEENIDLIDVYDKVKSAFNVDKVTKKFYDHFKKEHDAFLGFIDGITDMGDQAWYASVMLNRLMFIYFIQKKGFLEGDTDYLRNRLTRVQALKGKGKFHTFYRYFMLALCHEVLAKKERTLDKDLAALIGNVPYLNGGIFQPHELELKYGEEINIPDEAFVKIFDFFDQYEWHLDNRPAANANEINPDVLGYIFEKYINQKQMGAYYTKEDITEYISKNTIIPCLFDKAQKACKIAFEGEASVWNLLKDDPDRYIYPAVRHGVSHNMHTDVELEKPVPYPAEIETGLDTKNPDLLERRKKWNTRTPPEAGLPTEIWRETVARRQRYEEVKGKLERGEVQGINDLITLNLDIRQFVQDVIERCESPDLLNAFWTAIAGYVPTSGSNKKAVAAITVLDPTCGSGAFLFAALNILEPLYEACLERMKGFLEEWESSATVSGANASETLALHSKHPNYARFFQSIRDDIGKHPSPKYFIYKSIIIHNLYGVDIMKEAVEICKLRLFLKLVAQVEDGSKIEPLPDIDFNIRAGNTLVGFATEEEMKRAMQGDLLAYSTVLPEILEQAEECDRLFNLFREAQLEGDGSLTKAKAKLTGKLDDLNARLNQYLADDYGIDRKKKGGFEKFLQSHQPFHWFIEFYGIIKSGGFDTIIGNPPYVEYKKVIRDYRLPDKQYASEASGNLYAFCMERICFLLMQSGYFGMIVPTSLVGLGETECLRKILLNRFNLNWFSTYAIRPSKLFDGVDQRLCIQVATRSGNPSEEKIYSSGYRHWNSDEREALFARLHYTVSFEHPRLSRLPQVGDAKAVSVLLKLESKMPKSTEHYYASASCGMLMHYHRSPRYWIRGMDFDPHFKSPMRSRSVHHFRDIYLSDDPIGKFVGGLINSSLFFFWFLAVGNGRNITGSDIEKFPIGIVCPHQLASTEKWFDQLMEDYRRNSIIRERKDCEFQEFRPSLSKPIIDEIDKVLAKHYGFTEEELDYIINYDIKYRMGKDLLEEGK